MPVPSVPRTSGRSLVALLYFIIWDSLHQSSMSGSFTLVVRNEIDMPVSGLPLACFLANKIFAIMLCSFAAEGSFSHLSSTANKSFGAAQSFVPFSLGATDSYVLSSSLMYCTGDFADSICTEVQCTRSISEVLKVLALPKVDCHLTSSILKYILIFLLEGINELAVDLWVSQT
jgi:hypothetical protein